VANEYIDQLRPRDFLRLNGAPINEVDIVQRGVVGTLPLLKGDTAGYSAFVFIPHNLTIATGFTFELGLVDDGNNANDLGKVVRLGVQVKRLVSGTDNLTATGAAAEQTVDVTLDATTNELVAGSLAIANANLDGVATGERMLLLVRRIGTASQDTAPGCVLLTHVAVRNT
jgi:hypothetical protein